MKKWQTFLIVLVLLIGLSLLLYPTVSDYWNSLRQSHAINKYMEGVARLDNADVERMLREAEAYNQKLASGESSFYPSAEELEEYNRTLDVSGTGMMGYLEIPKIGVSLPVYHTVDDEVLKVGVGHIPGSSLPVGGASTHSVVSGHTGLPSATLLTELDKLSEGDIFLVKVLNRTLTYQVDQIKKVLPEETGDLAIVPEQDYFTLVTCTPYGVNTHRLLVRGRRIPTEDVINVSLGGDAMRVEPVQVIPFLAAPLLFLLFLLFMIFGGRSKKPVEPGITLEELLQSEAAKSPAKDAPSAEDPPDR